MGWREVLQVSPEPEFVKKEKEVAIEDSQVSLFSLFLASGKHNIQEIQPFSLDTVAVERAKEILANDWEWVSSDPALAEGFVRACVQLEQLRSGVAPKHYTSSTFCAGCNSVVAIPPGMEGIKGRVLGCPHCQFRANKSKH